MPETLLVPYKYRTLAFSNHLEFVVFGTTICNANDRKPSKRHGDFLLGLCARLQVTLQAERRHVDFDVAEGERGTGMDVSVLQVRHPPAVDLLGDIHVAAHQT